MTRRWTLPRHAIAEHHEMDEMVEDLEERTRLGAGWPVRRKLCDKVEHHLEEEESKFFQEAGKVLTEAQKLSLAKDYEAEFLTLRVEGSRGLSLTPPRAASMSPATAWRTPARTRR